MKLNTLRTVFGAALVGAVFSAQAFSLNLTFGTAGSQTATISGPAVVPIGNPVSAGAFGGSLTGGSGFDATPFYTYCVQLTEWAQGSGAQTGYSIVSGTSVFSSTVVDRLGKLFTVLGGANLPTSADQSAGIQLAVWESVYEGINPLSLGNGTFMATSTTTAVTNANNLLTSASALATSLYSVSVLTNSSNQDFLLVQRVPEPASLALVGLALAGLAFTRRRA